MAECQQCAKEIFKRLPAKSQDLLSKPFTGAVISFADPTQISPPGVEDVKSNFCFIQPIVRMWGDKVCSGYCVADIIVCLNVLCKGNLLTRAHAGEAWLMSVFLFCFSGPWPQGLSIPFQMYSSSLLECKF